MTIGADRVQLLKQESSGLGGDGADAVDWPQPINPLEDAIEVAGVYLQDASNRDENVYIERDGNDMRFRDLTQTTPLTLAELYRFGSFFEQAESNGESTTTNTAFQTKLTHTTASVPVGNYVVHYSMELRLSAHGLLTPGQVEAQFRLNATEEGLIILLSGAANDHRVCLAGMKYFTVGTAGTQTFDLRYRTQNGGDTAAVSRARLQFWRV